MCPDMLENRTFSSSVVPKGDLSGSMIQSEKKVDEDKSLVK
jgi:hypothetical protein